MRAQAQNQMNSQRILTTGIFKRGHKRGHLAMPPLSRQLLVAGPVWHAKMMQRIETIILVTQANSVCETLNTPLSTDSLLTWRPWRLEELWHIARRSLRAGSLQWCSLKLLLWYYRRRRTNRTGWTSTWSRSTRQPRTVWSAFRRWTAEETRYLPSLKIEQTTVVDSYCGRPLHKWQTSAVDKQYEVPRC